MFHSDHGSVYASKAYAALCEQLKLTQSLGAVGTSADNSLAESFNAALKRELLEGAATFPDQATAYRAVFRWANRYNTRRRHSANRPDHPEQLRERLRRREVSYARGIGITEPTPCPRIAGQGPRGPHPHRGRRRTDRGGGDRGGGDRGEAAAAAVDGSVHSGCRRVQRPRALHPLPLVHALPREPASPAWCAGTRGRLRCRRGGAGCRLGHGDRGFQHSQRCAKVLGVLLGGFA